MSSSAGISASELGNFVRLAPLQLSEVPAHMSLPMADSRPPLLPFLLAVLDEGASFLSPASFKSNFKPLSKKRSSETANVEVEVHQCDIPQSTLQSLNFNRGTIPQRSPANGSLQTEHWFSRHSRHKPLSSKAKDPDPSCASWDEFVYGIRDNHSLHEFDFTPTLYDAHHILDWNADVQALESSGELRARGYSHTTMAIYEMCHAIPFPLQPRCFSVLVITTSTSPTSFLAVTIPIDLSSFSGSFYSTKQNLKAGAVTAGQDPLLKKDVVVGAYAAVETVYIDERDGMIDWTMATASDTRGNLPMWAQKMGLPGAVVKDVGLFLKWIRTVDDGDIQKQRPETKGADPTE